MILEYLIIFQYAFFKKIRKYNNLKFYIIFLKRIRILSINISFDVVVIINRLVNFRGPILVRSRSNFNQN